MGSFRDHRHLRHELNDEPGRIDRYLPWSEDAPDQRRLSPAKAKQASEMPNKPIFDPRVIESVLESS